MGVGHSMNADQVESVLSNFEDTMKAIKGIEQKADRVNEMLSETQRQQDALHGQMDRAQDFVKSVTDSMNLRSSQVRHFRESLEGIVAVVEKLEDTLYDLGLRDLPGKMQREFGPIFVPVLVLTLIVTVSNCAFGFFLAFDDELAAQGGTMNMVNIFATIHVVLIGLAVLHLVVEVCLRVLKLHRRRKAAKTKARNMKDDVDDGQELPDEDEQPRPRAMSDPGIVVMATDDPVQLQSGRMSEPQSGPMSPKSPGTPGWGWTSQDGRKSAKSVGSKETNTSELVSPKRRTLSPSEPVPAGRGLTPAGHKAAISGMLRAALQQGPTLQRSGSASSLALSEHSNQPTERIMGALQAMKKVVSRQELTLRARGLRRQATSSDVANNAASDDEQDGRKASVASI